MPARVDKAMADGSAIKGSEDAMARCNELDAELAELRAAYEQYFMGNDRLPPAKKHAGFRKQYMKLKNTFVRQTAAKFRIESIGQKLLTYERLWDRTMKEIEAGTHKRVLLKLRRKQGAQEQKAKRADSDSDFDVDEDLDLSDLDDGHDNLSAALAAAEAAASARPAIKPVTGLVPAITPVTPPSGVRSAGGIPSIVPVTPPHGLRPLTAPIPVTPAGGVRPAGPPKITGAFAPARAPVTSSSPPARAAGPGGGDGGLSDTKIRAIYDAYVMAKKRCGEDTRSVTLDSVSSSLRKQVPELMKSHNAKTVEFKVVIKDGKAVLRALPKE